MTDARPVLHCPRCATDQYVTSRNDFYKTELWHGTGPVCETCFRHLVQAAHPDVSEYRTVLEEGRA